MTKTFKAMGSTPALAGFLGKARKSSIIIDVPFLMKHGDTLFLTAFAAHYGGGRPAGEEIFAACPKPDRVVRVQDEPMNQVLRGRTCIYRPATYQCVYRAFNHPEKILAGEGCARIFPVLKLSEGSTLPCN
jgi:hypothetical protein